MVQSNYYSFGVTEIEAGMSGKYVLVSGCIFGFVAVAQVLRAISQLPVHVGSFEIPVWTSWVAAVVAGGLSAWAFRSQK